MGYRKNTIMGLLNQTMSSVNQHADFLTKHLEDLEYS